MTLRELLRWEHYRTILRAEEALDGVTLAIFPHVSQPAARAAMLRAWRVQAGHEAADDRPVAARDRTAARARLRGLLRA